jgi:hypothetical protein
MKFGHAVGSCRARFAKGWNHHGKQGDQNPMQQPMSIRALMVNHEEKP